MKRYAADTTVNSARSRGEIDEILRAWGCKQIMWGDDYEEGRAMLRFLWSNEGVDYVARFVITIPTDEALRSAARTEARRKFSQSKFELLQKRRGWAEHRQLFIWLKASFNAVEAGIVEASTIFLPFIEDAEGVTVGERLLADLPKILNPGGVANLLAIPETIE